MKYKRLQVKTFEFIEHLIKNFLLKNLLMNLYKLTILRLKSSVFPSSLVIVL